MKLKTALLIFAALVTSTAVRADLITNGGFETGDFSGWTRGGDTQYTGVCAGGSLFPGTADAPGTLCTVHSGGFAAGLGPPDAAVDLYQDVGTTAGDLYTLTFYLRNDNNVGFDVNNSFDVYFGGTDIWSGTNLADTDQAFTSITISNLVASGDTTELKFSAQNGPGGFFLDDVSLAPVPEPASFLLLTIALLGFGLVRRKRHTA